MFTGERGTIQGSVVQQLLNSSIDKRRQKSREIQRKRGMMWCVCTLFTALTISMCSCVSVRPTQTLTSITNPIHLFSFLDGLSFILPGRPAHHLTSPIYSSTQAFQIPPAPVFTLSIVKKAFPLPPCEDHRTRQWVTRDADRFQITPLSLIM